MRFVIDAQLPPALAAAITEAGHFAEHVADVGLLEADDRAIWHFALANNAVIITKDEDFVSISHRTFGEVTVVWLRLGNASRGALLRWFLPLLPQIMTLIEIGEVLVEIRPNFGKAE